MNKIILIILIIFAIGGVCFLLNTTRQNQNARQSQLLNSTTTQPTSDPSVYQLTTTPETGTIIKGNEIKISVQNIFYPDELFTYTFKFDRQNGDEVSTLASSPYNPESDASGVQITRGEVILTIKPVFEGVNIMYESEIPEIIEIPLTKISDKQVYRVQNPNLEYGYAYYYVNDFSTECNQWKPKPAACHSSNIRFENNSLQATCEATSKTVSECDNLMQNINLTITKKMLNKYQ